MLHCVFAGNSLILVVDQHFIEEVNGFRRASVLVAVGDESLEGGSFSRLDKFRYLLGQVKLVSAKVFLQVVCPHHADNTSHLVIIVAALEEGVNVEEHASEGAAEGPDIK